MISAVLVTIIIDSSDINHLFIVKHHSNDENVLYRTEIDNYDVDISYIRVLTPGDSPGARSRPSPKTMPNDKTDVDSSNLKHVGEPVGCDNGLGNVILGVVHVIQTWTRSQTRHSELGRRLVPTKVCRQPPIPHPLKPTPRRKWPLPVLVAEPN